MPITRLRPRHSVASASHRSICVGPKFSHTKAIALSRRVMLSVPLLPMTQVLLDESGKLVDIWSKHGPRQLSVGFRDSFGEFASIIVRFANFLEGAGQPF